jgi:hypothetical protein
MRQFYKDLLVACAGKYGHRQPRQGTGKTPYLEAESDSVASE